MGPRFRGGDKSVSVISVSDSFIQNKSFFMAQAGA
jgi:hypothetical protein